MQNKMIFEQVNKLSNPDQRKKGHSKMYILNISSKNYLANPEESNCFQNGDT